MEWLPLDLAAAVCRSFTTHGDLPRLAGSCRALSRVVRRLLRDRSSYSVWRHLCSRHQAGSGALVGVTDYCALYFRLRGLQAPTRHEMTISDLQLIVNVAMWTAEPGECTRSETVFTEVLHGAQASIAIPDDEIEQSGDLGYKWTVPGGRLLELPASLAPPGGSDLGDRYQEQLAQLNRLARDGENNFDKQPPPWAAPEYAEERVGKRTWVLSVTAFRPSALSKTSQASYKRWPEWCRSLRPREKDAPGYARPRPVSRVG